MTELDDTILECARLYDVDPDDLRNGYDEWVSGLRREPMLPSDVEYVAEMLTPHQPGEAVRAGVLPMKRSAAIYWARAARVPASRVLAFIDEGHAASQYKGDRDIDMGKIAKAFPIELPEDLSEWRYNSDFQKALLFDQLAEVNLAMTYGGDDNWFDYLPDGIAILSHLQSESWDDMLLYVRNNWELFAEYDEDKIHPAYSDMSFQDVVSGLLLSVLPERNI